MLLDVVNQYDSQKIAFFRDLWEKVVLQIAMKEDHKKIVSFLNKTGIISIDEHEKIVYI